MKSGIASDTQHYSQTVSIYALSLLRKASNNGESSAKRTFYCVRWRDAIHASAVLRNNLLKVSVKWREDQPVLLPSTE